MSGWLHFVTYLQVVVGAGVEHAGAGVSRADGRRRLADIGRSFRVHVRLARESGANPKEIRDVVRFLAECGIPKAAAALRELNTILEAV